jgi:flavin-binding protein dodecin
VDGVLTAFIFVCRGFAGAIRHFPDSPGLAGRIDFPGWLTVTTEERGESKGDSAMSIGKVIELSATSPKSFEDAIQQGMNRAAETIEDIRGAWIKEFEVRCENGKITEYRVNMKVTFILHDKTK